MKLCCRSPNFYSYVMYLCALLQPTTKKCTIIDMAMFYDFKMSFFLISNMIQKKILK